LRQHFTKPAFFSRITSAKDSTMNDQYWHEHVDRDTYGSFSYTALVYLNDFGADFTGGEFVFADGATVQPRAGRVSFFSAGWENPHRVNRVLSGTRLALTVSFTCEDAAALKR
jgi:hypothetical protein